MVDASRYRSATLSTLQKIEWEGFVEKQKAESGEHSFPVDINKGDVSAKVLIRPRHFEVEQVELTSSRSHEQLPKAKRRSWKYRIRTFAM